jgi:fumarylacetoacetase
MTGAVAGAEQTLFPVESLPYGVFSESARDRRIGVAIGDFVLDVGALARSVGLDRRHADVLQAPTLNSFMAAGPASWRNVRNWLTELLSDGRNAPAVEPFLHPTASVRLHLPFQVADYVDFYSSEHHAANVGRILRPGTEPLSPNWKHLPIGYHGRAGTVVVSGTPIRRPWGQEKDAVDAAPTFAPSRRLDVEVEVGFVVGVGTTLGDTVEVGAFADHVFGLCLLNDWSARDIQAFEYVPLGPFLAKSFATSVSPWILPLAALEAARRQPPPRDVRPMPYLADAEPWGLDLHLELECNGTILSRPPFAGMYWTAAQQLAHLTVNGANLRTGDLYGSGTVSGSAAGERGSLLELSWNGTEPISLRDGSARSFLEDGDVITIRGTAPGTGGLPISLGEVTGRILPATSREPSATATGSSQA